MWCRGSWCLTTHKSQQSRRGHSVIDERRRHFVCLRSSIVANGECTPQTAYFYKPANYPMRTWLVHVGIAFILDIFSFEREIDCAVWSAPHRFGWPWTEDDVPQYLSPATALVSPKFQRRLCNLAEGRRYRSEPTAIVARFSSAPSFESLGTTVSSGQFDRLGIGLEQNLLPQTNSRSTIASWRSLQQLCRCST